MSNPLLKDVINDYGDFVFTCRPTNSSWASSIIWYYQERHIENKPCDYQSIYDILEQFPHVICCECTVFAAQCIDDPATSTGRVRLPAEVTLVVSSLLSCWETVSGHAVNQRCSHNSAIHILPASWAFRPECGLMSRPAAQDSDDSAMTFICMTFSFSAVRFMRH